jgi:hypothetical protein
MKEPFVDIEEMVKNLSSREVDQIVIGNDLSEALGFDASGGEPDLSEMLELFCDMGLEIDQEKFRQLAAPFESAEGLSHYLTDSGILDIEPYSHMGDDLFFILTYLWELWIPERPSMEKLEDYIRLGYKFLEKGEKCKCCISWLAVFPRVWEIMAKRHQQGTGDPFEAFETTFSNWIQDLETELRNLGRFEHPYFHKQLIAVAEAYLQCCQDFDSDITESMQGALADTYFLLGETAKAGTLFENWLKEDPTWGWGWIYWSDCYSSGALYHPLDYAKAEAILKKGLAHKKVRDKKYMLDRLSNIYKETGRE